jgi:hypothetical protein
VRARSIHWLPAGQVVEIMLTDVTVNVPPRLAIPDASLELDALDGVETLDDDDEDGDGAAGSTVDDCGVDVVGLCAASVPHSTIAVLSVTAHRR